MNSKDLLIVALAPLAVLLIPFIGNLTVEGWNWTGSDFVFGRDFSLGVITGSNGRNIPFRKGQARAIPS